MDNVIDINVTSPESLIVTDREEDIHAEGATKYQRSGFISKIVLWDDE